MGKCKALLQAGPFNFLEAQLQALANGGCHPVIAVVSKKLSEIIKNSPLLRGDLVVNPRPEDGQISSVRLAIKDLGKSDGVLLVLVDQGPVLDTTISRLIQEFKNAQTSVVIACYNGKPGHPVIFSQELFAAIESTLADQGAQAVVERQMTEQQVSLVETDDSAVVRNINQPEDYQRFLSSINPAGFSS